MIASVGHHTDRTLIDDVAAVACSTPTHAAEAAVPLDCAAARAALGGARRRRLERQGRRAVVERARALGARCPARPPQHVDAPSRAPAPAAARAARERPPAARRRRAPRPARAAGARARAATPRAAAAAARPRERRARARRPGARARRPRPAAHARARLRAGRGRRRRAGDHAPPRAREQRDLRCASHDGRVPRASGAPRALTAMAEADDPHLRGRHARGSRRSSRRLDSGEAGLRETLELVPGGPRSWSSSAPRELEAVGQGLEELQLDELVARLEPS